VRANIAIYSNSKLRYCYLCQGSYVSVSISLFLAVVHKIYSADSHKIRWKGGMEETIRLWW